MDLTVTAIPFFFGSMGAEQWYLARREGDGPSAVSYTKNDTAASLSMGTLSLLVPLATRPLANRIAPQRSRVGKALVGIAAISATATTLADVYLRSKAQRAGTQQADGKDESRALSEGGDPSARDDVIDRLAQGIARWGGPITIAAGTVAASTAWSVATSAKNLWRRRRVRDLGTGAGAVAGAIAGWDFIYYFNHRVQHEVRALWAIHVVHHSSERYNLSTALRQPVAEALGVFVPYGLLSLFGIQPALVETARGVNLIYQFWIHTDAIKTLGPVEEIFNTPSHHRVHHGSNGRYIDRNHGSILILWDRLFSTFTRERDDDPVVYGLTKNIDTYNPAGIATHEYRDILHDVADSVTWRDRLSFVLRGPGWAYERHRSLQHPGHSGARFLHGADAANAAAAPAPNVA